MENFETVIQKRGGRPPMPFSFVRKTVRLEASLISRVKAAAKAQQVQESVVISEAVAHYLKHVV